MHLPEGEPAAGPWRALSASELADRVLALTGVPAGRPAVLAIDGRGAAGKSTLAEVVVAAVPGAVVVHTDDLAWHEPFFGWGHLLRDGVLAPLHRGETVHFTPPQWEPRGRTGVIEVPAGSPLVVVEGTGAGQRTCADLVDAVVWVQSDFAAAEDRGVERDVASGVNGDRAQAAAFWHEWMGHELRFLAEDRPWQRAALVVAGTPVADLGVGEYAVAPGPLPDAPGAS